MVVGENFRTLSSRVYCGVIDTKAFSISGLCVVLPMGHERRAAMVSTVFDYF